MLTAMRRRSAWAVAASVLAHLGVLIAVLLQHPTLTLPEEPAGPPEAIIPVLILPRTPPPFGARGAKPAPIQLHRRALRNQPAETTVAPLVLPAAKPSEAPTPAPSPTTTKETQPATPPADAIRATLRASLGCNASTLSREERARCQERFGRGAHDEPYLAQPLSGAKQRLLDAAAARKEDNDRYKHGTVPNGSGPGGPLGADPREAKVPF
jgi:hypothetical protein